MAPAGRGTATGKRLLEAGSKVFLADRTEEVVITRSVAGLQGTPGMAVYGTSKHAVIGSMRTAATEWGEASHANGNTFVADGGKRA